MAFRVNPRGLVATRTLNGGTSFRTQLRPTRGANLESIFPGDLVYLNSNGRVQKALVGTAAGQPLLGVVRAVYNKNFRPRTFAQPTTSAYVAVSTTAWLEVYEDPDIIYTINCSASCGDVHIGQFANIVMNVGNTAAGISGMSLDLVDVTATSIGHALQVYAVSSNEAGPQDPMTATGGANNDVEVRIAQHQWRGLRARAVEEHSA